MEPSTLLRCKNLGGPFPHPHVTDVTGVTEICNVTGYQSRAEQSRSEQKPPTPEGRQARLYVGFGSIFAPASFCRKTLSPIGSPRFVRRRLSSDGLPWFLTGSRSVRPTQFSRIAATLSRVNQIIRRKSGDHGANHRGQDFEPQTAREARWGTTPVDQRRNRRSGLSTGQQAGPVQGVFFFSDSLL